MNRSNTFHPTCQVFPAPCLLNFVFPGKISMWVSTHYVPLLYQYSIYDMEKYSMYNILYYYYYNICIHIVTRNKMEVSVSRMLVTDDVSPHNFQLCNLSIYDWGLLCIYVYVYTVNIQIMSHFMSSLCHHCTIIQLLHHHQILWYHIGSSYTIYHIGNELLHR